MCFSSSSHAASFNSLSDSVKSLGSNLSGHMPPSAAPPLPGAQFPPTTVAPSDNPSYPSNYQGQALPSYAQPPQQLQYFEPLRPTPAMMRSSDMGRGRPPGPPVNY